MAGKMRRQISIRRISRACDEGSRVCVGVYYNILSSPMARLVFCFV